MNEPLHIDTKTSRLEARITGEQKALIHYAAHLAGRSVTDFVVSSVQEAASRTVREHEVLTLRGRDRQVFVEALLKPPSPGQRLRRAASRYRTAIGR